MNIRKLHPVKTLLVILTLNIIIIILFYNGVRYDECATLDCNVNTDSHTSVIRRIKFFAYIGDPISQLCIGDMYAFNAVYSDSETQINHEQALYWYTSASAHLADHVPNALPSLKYAVVLNDFANYKATHNESDFTEAMWWLKSLSQNGRYNNLESCNKYMDKLEFADCILGSRHV